MFLSLALPLLPFIWVPINPKNTQKVLLILIAANYGIALMVLFLNASLDLTTKEKLSNSVVILSFTLGLLVGYTLHNQSFRLEWIPTQFGDIPVLMYVGHTKTIYNVYSLILVISLIRYGIVGYYRIKESAEKRPMDIDFKKSFVFYNLTALSIWFILSFIKKNWIPELMGIDALIASLMYAALIKTYTNNRKKLYFYPGTLELLIVNHTNGEHILDYDFTTRRVLRGVKNYDQEEKLLRYALFGAVSVFQQALPKDITPEEYLKNIQFRNTQIIVHTTNHLVFILVSRKNSKMYNHVLKRIAEKIEREESEKLEKISKGIAPSKKLIEKIIEPWKKIN